MKKFLLTLSLFLFVVFLLFIYIRSDYFSVKCNNDGSGCPETYVKITCAFGGCPQGHVCDKESYCTVVTKDYMWNSAPEDRDLNNF